MKRKVLKKIFIITALTLPALLAAAWFFVSHQLSQLETYKSSLTATLSKALSRDVTYETGKATLTIRQGLALQFTGVTIREKDGSADWLSVKTAWARVDLLPLLFNRIALGEVVLDHPRLSLKRDREGLLNIADLLTMDEKQRMAVTFKKLTLEHGQLTFIDQSIAEKDLVTRLTDISCRIKKMHFSNKSSLHFSATLRENRNEGEIKIDGTFRPAPADQPVTETPLEATFRLTGANMQHYLPYVSSRTAIEKLGGRLEAEATFSGTLSRHTAKGTVRIKDARLSYPGVFKRPVKSPSVEIDYRLAREGGNLQLDIARLALDSFAAAGRITLSGSDQEDPRLTVTAATSTFSLRKIHDYVPWKIIPGGVGDFIEAHIPDGNFRLMEGKLDGHLSQIANMNQPENAGVLFIRAEVQNGVFFISKTTPVFQDLNGTLELANRQFLLKKVKGRFGASPCRVDGGISDFSLPTPTVYTAEMTLQPARSEILWLLGKEQFPDFKFDGESTLHLSGKGPAEQYRISARWDVTPAAYAFPYLLEKPKGKPNTLACEILLNHDRLLVPSFQYDLGPIGVKGNAGDLFAPKKPVSFHIQSRAFDLGDIAPLLPGLRTADPKGTGSIDLTGRGNLGDSTSFRWKGNLTLMNVSLKPPGNVKPLKGLTGKASFLDHRMETSLFKASLGDSPFQMKCGIDQFRKPKFACQFDSALLKTADLGLQSPEDEVNFQTVRGKIIFEDQSLRLDRLSFRLGKSRFHLAGDIRDFEHPKITASLHSRYIHWDDIDRLMSLKDPKRAETASTDVEISATLRVDAGVFHGIDFTRLNTRLRYAEEILTIETLEAGVFEGTVKGKLRMDKRPDGQTRYAADMSLDRISLDKIQGYLELDDRTVTGKLSLTGHLTATGNNEEDLKKTAAGTFQVKAEKGVLKKFAVLSKIFSLLNVSQLFKFQLPDMARGGMPYNAITGKVTLGNGVLSSEDFFIAGDAMQMSLAGKIDYLNKELDNIVGVHPLQTVDKIVSKIPVAGWLVTDDKGNLITVHFKVTGTWDNPSVTAIPVQSVAKGTLDIFRRLFQLPEKLITDTGEVILGR